MSSFLIIMKKDDMIQDMTSFSLFVDIEHRVNMVTGQRLKVITQIK